MAQSAISCYVAILHCTQLFFILFEFLYVLLFFMTVCFMLDCVMFDISRVTYMAGWIEIEIVINLLVIFKLLYHIKINVFYYVH